jgi:CheY-like chemotaxis protein
MSSPESKLVLVVDDEAPIRETLADALEFEGYTVVTATNGFEALERVRGCQPAAVLLDLMMPIMTGWDFLRVCRKEQLCAQTPILVMSAYRRLAEESSTLGASACIAKPFDLDVLLAAIDHLVRRTA